MDSTPEDDVLVISKFLSRLQSNLLEETETTTSLEAQLKELSLRSNINYDDINPDITDDLKPHDAKELEDQLPDDIKEQDRLRKENIRLLMALQRQDYLASSYERMLAEHQDLLDSINNSIVNRKNYVDVKNLHDESLFKEKCLKLENEIGQLKSQNEKYDEIFNKTLQGIRNNLKNAKEGLQTKDTEESKILIKLQKLEHLIEEDVK